MPCVSGVARLPNRMMASAHDVTELRPRIAARDFGAAFALAALGCLGALPATPAGPDPVATLVWIALAALPIGVGAGAIRLRAWPLAPVIPAVWMVVLTMVDAASPRDLPTPGWGALVWTGLFAFGFALGRRWPARGAAIAAIAFGACALLAALPSGFWALEKPWPPALAARMLDLSPVTLLAECAGLDWLRHPAVYESAGTADIDPSLRSAYRGVLAGPASFLVGCATVAVVRGRR